MLELMDAGISQKIIAEKFNVSQPAISYIKANREKLKEQCTTIDEANQVCRKRIGQNMATSELEGKLYAWFKQTRAAGVPVSGRLLQEVALIINESLNGPKTFQASNGYLYNFQLRHGIRHLSMQGEKLSADATGAAEFREQFISYTQDFGFDRDNIYNADETGLLWKVLPGSTLATKDDKGASGWKLIKDRVTVMVCANASGTHRMPLLMIGKSKNPRCFKGMNVEALPLVYTNQRNAWMDTEIFRSWYTGVFLPAVTVRHSATGKKCILVLDNAPTHPPAHELNSISDLCSVVYLPPNVTSLIQPMDQGVIAKLKKLVNKFIYYFYKHQICYTLKQYLNFLNILL